MNTAAVECQAPRRRQWRSWTADDPTLAGLAYERMRDELRHGTDDRKDQLLGALVRIAQDNPEMVAVVVACLLPGLRALIRRHARGLEPAEALAVGVAGVCESISRYRPDENTSFVASRLLQLPKRHLQRAVSGQDTWRRHSRRLPDRADASGRLELDITTCLSLAVNAGVLTSADAWLIHATRVAERSVGWAARQLDIGYEAAKKRRRRAEIRWAAWWAPETRRHPFPSSFVDPQPKEAA